MGKFEEIQVGDVAEISHRVTADDVRRFAEVSGDDNRLHLDIEYAKQTPFKEPVAHGMLGASFISAIIGTRLPGDGALWCSQTLEFLLPVRIGDDLVVRAEVKTKIPRTRMLELQTTVTNQEKKKVIMGTALVKIVEAAAPAKADPTDTMTGRRAKVALVTGGTGGVGEATCLRLAQDGLDVAVHFHKRKEKAADIVHRIVLLGRRAIAVQADIRDEASIGELVRQTRRHFDSIDALVHAASLRIPSTKFNEIEWAQIDEQIMSNVKASFHLLKAVVPIMEAQRFGKIVHFTSQAVETPNADWLAYITGKAALVGFTKALAVDLAPKGIRVNMVSPGMTDTDLISDIPEKVRLVTAARTPLRRLATPADIAGVVSFLVSESADFLAGETIRINGGQVMI